MSCARHLHDADPRPSPPRPVEPRGDTRPVVLIVTSDATLCDWSHELLGPRFEVLLRHSVAGAEAMMASTPIDAVIADAFVDGRCGLLFLESVRLRGSRLPLLLRMTAPNAEEIHMARRANIQIVTTSRPVHAFRGHLARLVASAGERRSRRDMAVERLCADAALTPAEYETLVVYLRIGDRQALASCLGIAETSVRSRVRRLCRKLHIPRLHDVYRLLFEAALAA